jgi:uncharacterized protein (TIGR02145 family)
MKKVFQSAMILSLLLLSCADEADTNGNVTGAVGFHTADVHPQGDPTRAGVVCLNSLQTSGFRVSAYPTGTGLWASVMTLTYPDIMCDQPVTWGGSAWEYAPAAYWPDIVSGTDYGKVTFFAWNGGTGATVSGNVTGTPTLTYTVPDAPGDQKDLVTDVVTDQTVETNGGIVPFTFGHVLSRIGFKAKLDKEYPGKTVRITSLIVNYGYNKVESKGVYTFGATTHAVGGWTPPATKVYMDNAGYAVLSAAVELDNTATPQSVDLTDNARNNYLMLLPQDVDQGDITIAVTWTVDGAQKSQTIPLPKQTWLPGKCYDYVLKVSETRITLLPVLVDPWGDSSLYTDCTITYDANDGTGRQFVEHRKTNITYSLGGQCFGRDLYRIWAWTPNPAGYGNSYTPGQNITYTYDMTLYAQWIPVSDGMSNCYIMEPNESKEFSILRAYTYEKETFTNTLRTGGEYTGEFYVEKIWDDNNVIQRYVTPPFQTSTTRVMSVATTNNVGNALLAVKRSDNHEIIWSYHIWVTSYKGENPILMANGHKFMDRNLGATANDLEPTAYGLLYQWGRKDPFRDDSYNPTYVDSSVDNGTIIYSIKNPTHFIKGVETDGTNNDWLYGSTRNDYLWNEQATNTKTIYDPCPHGWRVPAFKDNIIDVAYSPWMEYDDSTYATKLDETNPRVRDNTGWTFKHKNGQTTSYPAAGYRPYDSGMYIWPGRYGLYWSSTRNDEVAIGLASNEVGNVEALYGQRSAYAFSIRCVRE